MVGTTITARTNAPRTIRYQPKILKSCFFTKSINSLMTARDTANATTEPMRRYPISAPVIVPTSMKNFNSLYALAPTMVGMARKKVNSAAVVLDTPSKSAPMMVMPEREVPGIAARSWKHPIKKAYLYESWEIYLIFASFLKKLSITINTIP